MVIIITRYLVKKAGEDVSVSLSKYTFPLSFRTQKWLYVCGCFIVLVGMSVIIKGWIEGNNIGIWIGFVFIFLSILAMLYLFRREYILTENKLIIKSLFKIKEIDMDQINKLELVNQHIYIYLDKKTRVELDPFVSDMSLLLSLIKKLTFQYGKRRI